MFQKRSNPSRQRTVDFALPDHQRFPVHFPKSFHRGFVSLAGFCNLGNPVIPIRFRFSRAVRTVVTVPETSVHEDCFAAGNKGKVGLSRQVLSMQPVTVSHGMYEPAHGHFRLGVAALDSSHNAAALFIHRDSVAATLCMYRTRLRRTSARGSICFRRHSGSTLEVYWKKNVASLNEGGSCI